MGKKLGLRSFEFGLDLPFSLSVPSNRKAALSAMSQHCRNVATLRMQCDMLNVMTLIKNFK